jgi:hypothetical protein
MPSALRHHLVSLWKARILVLTWLIMALTKLAVAQEEKAALPDAPVARDNNGCVQPVPMLSVSDVNGRFKKVEAFLTHKVELKTVHRPYSGKGPRICGLTAGQKFDMFVQNGSEPLTFLTAGFNAALAQANNDDSAFGQGAGGYGKRFGTAVADDAFGSFFGTFLYPSLLREDPRYYRRATGSATRRLRHALVHVVVARSDSGNRMFNYSEWLTAGSCATLQNLYHPGNRRGFGSAATRVTAGIATDAGTDVLREFWPEIARTLKIPLLTS